MSLTNQRQIFIVSVSVPFSMTKPSNMFCDIFGGKKWNYIYIKLLLLFICCALLCQGVPQNGNTHKIKIIIFQPSVLLDYLKG
jgi:hypothetical protein